MTLQNLGIVQFFFCQRALIFKEHLRLDLSMTSVTNKKTLGAKHYG
jgi:hypothetical protein